MKRGKFGMNHLFTLSDDGTLEVTTDCGSQALKPVVMGLVEWLTDHGENVTRIKREFVVATRFEKKTVVSYETIKPEGVSK